MIPHAAIICLYEPFADVTDPNDSAARRILGAAQSIVSIVQQLASVVNEGAQNFTSVMHSSASVYVKRPFNSLEADMCSDAWSLLHGHACSSIDMRST